MSAPSDPTAQSTGGDWIYVYRQTPPTAVQEDPALLGRAITELIERKNLEQAEQARQERQARLAAIGRTLVEKNAGLMRRLAD